MDRNAADYDRYHGPDAREKPATIKVEIEIDESEVMACIESALGSHTYGIGYWGEVKYGEHATCVREREDEEDPEVPGPWRALDDAAIKRGLAVLARIQPKLFGRLLAGQGDGPLGDLLIQCALFGEERYG